jgi:hypothetical protein
VIARAALALIALLLACPLAAAAVQCPEAGRFSIPDTDLPATRAAVAKRNVPILVLGGAATAGGAARGSEFTYPARLAARLRDALPGVEVSVTVRLVGRRAGPEVLETVETALSQSKPVLVIWGLGATAAARGEDVDQFATTLEDAIDKVHAAHADLVLMTLQYAPSVVRLINLAPYRMAVIRTGEAAGVPVFDRYEFMRLWHNSGFVNLDATDTAERIVVARTVFDCMATMLAEGIANAIK